jgi:hypothetical protein
MEGMQPGEGHLEQRYTLVAQDAPRCLDPGAAAASINDAFIGRFRRFIQYSVGD